MVDMGRSDRTSQEIAAEAGTGPWAPKEYSSDPDYGEANLEAAAQALESDYTGEIADNGDGMSFEDVSAPALEKAASIFDEVYGKDEDPRVAAAEVYNQGRSDEPVVDTNTRERDWSDHPSGYSSSVLAHASYALEVIMGEEDDPLEVGENHPMDNIGQNGVARR